MDYRKKRRGSWSHNYFKMEVKIMLQRYRVLDVKAGEYVGEPESRKKWARRRISEIAKSTGRSKEEFEVVPEMKMVTETSSGKPD